MSSQVRARLHTLTFFVVTAVVVLLLFSCTNSTRISIASAQTAPEQDQTPRAVAGASISKSVSTSRLVALVIGNKDYADSPLKNPVNDAQSMEKALKGLGFEVILKINLTNKDFVDAVNSFAKKLGPDAVGLFYYSGHGMQVDGVNYLLPIGYQIEQDSDVPFEAYPAQRVLSTMGQTGCPLKIVILDACRNNPLPKTLVRNKEIGGKGLVRMDAPEGTIIGYATGPGRTASDGSNKSNGLYTGVLLEKMKAPGLKIEEVFKATRISVKDASKGSQTPWEESSLENDFYFTAPLPIIVPGDGLIMDTKARLQVNVNAPKATISIDNKVAPKGEYTLNLLDAEQQKVRVKVTAKGYDGVIMEVTLLRGKTVLQTVNLFKHENDRKLNDNNVADGPINEFPIGNKSIYGVVRDSPEFQTLAQGIDNSEIRETFEKDGPFTFFGPNETAFIIRLPDESPLKPLFAIMKDRDVLSTENKETLKTLLSYHTVKGRYTIDDLKKLPDGTNLPTLDNSIVVISNTGEGLKINGIPIIENDIPASNGLIHPIDTLLSPKAK